MYLDVLFRSYIRRTTHYWNVTQYVYVMKQMYIHISINASQLETHYNSGFLWFNSGKKLHCPWLSYYPYIFTVYECYEVRYHDKNNGLWHSYSGP